MNKFIDNQIKLFKIKYSTKKLINKYIDNPKYIILEIINNKINLEYANNSTRGELFVKIIEKTLEKYKINDTIIILHIADGYSYDDNPIFNYALPDGKLGLIFPDFNFIKYNLVGTFDDNKNLFDNYKSNKIHNDIYFKGNKTSAKKSRIREKLENENKPFNVIVSNEIHEEPYKMKDHKYLLDLPGFKPWSIRFKFLPLCERLFIRVSFYNSKYNETSHWKLLADSIYTENKDYIHFVYDVDYDNRIPSKIYNKIKKDILKTYYYFENHKNKYNKIVSHMTKKSKKLTFDYALKYIKRIINKYTKLLLILDHK
jgi:hypothetical protein